MRVLGFKFLLTRTLNQDPLENMFGIARGLCGQNTRPSCHQLEGAFKTILINNLMLNSECSNCEDDGGHFLASFLCSTPQQSPDTQQITSVDHNIFSVPQNQKVVTLVKQMRLATSSYIAGFIYRKVVLHNCKCCKEFFLSEDCTDSHAFIRLRDYSNKLFYPSETFISYIHQVRGNILHSYYYYYC